MGGPTSRKPRSRAKVKGYKKSHSTKRRHRDVDQIQDDFKLETQQKKPLKFEIDEDLPGLGQYYCTPCARHFIDASTRELHIRTKVHKRRLKDVLQEQYTQREADLGAGKTREQYEAARPTETVDMTM